MTGDRGWGRGGGHGWGGGYYDGGYGRRGGKILMSNFYCTIYHSARHKLLPTTFGGGVGGRTWTPYCHFCLGWGLGAEPRTLPVQSPRATE